MFVSELFTGRPSDTAGREPGELAVYDLLDSLNIPYNRVDHEEAHTIELCSGVEEVLGVPIVKNLFLCNRQKTEFYLLLIDGNKRFKTKYLSAQIQSARLSFAAPEDLFEMLGVRPGSASVFSLMNDPDNRVRLLIDASVKCYEKVGFHPCYNTSSLAVSLNDILEKFLSAVHHTPTDVDLPEEPVEEA